jgi:uncharacterized protein YodC (DUF2158 family)
MTEKAEHGIRSGDVVALCSGGPKMAVLDVGRDTGVVWRQWMDEGGNALSEAAFPPDAVRLFPEYRKEP